jgi:hypothetical protein
MIQISIEDTATPAVRDLLNQITNAKPIMQRVADAGRRTLQDWFRSRPGNKQGWPSSGLWRNVANATNVRDVTDTEATIAVSHPAIAQRVYGGVIKPKRGRYLTIPAMAAAYAAGSPREGGGPANLAFALSRHPQGGWRPSLVVQENVMKEIGKPRKDGTRRRKMVHQAGTIWYWLVRQVNQSADPNALPPDSLLQDTKVLSITSYLSTRTGARSQLA